MSFWDRFRSDLEREVAGDRARLIEILQMSDTSQRAAALRELATHLGPSTNPMYPGHGDASLPELVQHINVAIQTKAMIAAVRTSSNYVIATVILAIIAFFSTVAAFVSAVK